MGTFFYGLEEDAQRRPSEPAGYTAWEPFAAGHFFFFLQHPEGLMGKCDTISLPISSSANSLWLAAAPVVFLGQSLLSAWKGLKHFRTFLGFLC